MTSTEGAGPSRGSRPRLARCDRGRRDSGLPFWRTNPPISVMAAALEVDAYPGFSSWDLNSEAVSIVGAPEDVAVAVEDDVVCGYVSPSREDLTVHPEYRQRGHGRRLLAGGLELAAQRGLSEIRLYVPTSGAGQAFAKAMGMSYRSSLWHLDLAPETAVPIRRSPPPWRAASSATGCRCHDSSICSTPLSPAIPVPCRGSLARSSMPTTSPISTRQRSCLSHLSVGPRIRSPSFGPRLEASWGRRRGAGRDRSADRSGAAMARSRAGSRAAALGRGTTACPRSGQDPA